MRSSQRREQMSFGKVLVALDGSEHSHRALAAAKELASLSDGELRVVHVREVDAAFGRGGPLEVENEDTAQKYLRDTLTELSDSHRAATGVVRASPAGRIAVEITEEAVGWDASVIVVGSRGLNSLAAAVLGSIATKVIHLSKVPVLVVH
jgi:nucleotide-binding universal stress UspA family protein